MFGARELAQARPPSVHDRLMGGSRPASVAAASRLWPPASAWHALDGVEDEYVKIVFKSAHKVDHDSRVRKWLGPAKRVTRKKERDETPVDDADTMTPIVKAAAAHRRTERLRLQGGSSSRVHALEGADNFYTAAGKANDLRIAAGLSSKSLAS